MVVVVEIMDVAGAQVGGESRCNGTPMVWFSQEEQLLRRLEEVERFVRLFLFYYGDGYCPGNRYISGRKHTSSVITRCDVSRDSREIRLYSIVDIYPYTHSPIRTRCSDL